MYCDFFGLRCRPFEDRADTEFYFTTPEHEEAFASIEYEARYGHGMALLLGEPGTGKTLLVRTLLRKLPTSDRAVVLTWPASGQGDLVRETCKGFGISLPASHQSSRLATRLFRHIKRSFRAGHRSVLVIDQAENLTTQNLAELETITESQRDGESPLSIILSATPRFRDTLARDEFGRLRQKLFGERTVKPLTLEQTGPYIRHRLEVAGAGAKQPFSAEAIGPIFEASKGIPRLINRICDAAMVATYGAGLSTISGAVAAEVATTECGIERSVDLRRLGLEKGDLGVSDWPPGGGGSVAAPQPSRSVSTRAPSEEWGEPHVDPGPASDDFGGDDLRTSYPACEPEAGLAMEPVVAVQESVSRPGLPGTDRADTLINKLTRVTARAERAGATTEASVAQYSAIEKHLAVLNADAERLAGRLAETARNTASLLGTMEKRLASLEETAEDKVASVEEKVSRAAHVANELQERIAGVQEACLKGDRVQSQLTAFADELADKGHGVQERMAQLMTSVESSDAAQHTLAELLQRISTTAAQTNAELTRTVDESVQRIESVVGEAASRSAHAREEMESTLDRASSFFAEIRQRVDRQLSEEIEKRVRSGQASIEAVLSRAATVAADADRAVGAVEEKLGSKTAEAERFIEKTLNAKLADFERATSKILSAAAAKKEDLESGMLALERRCDEVASTLTSLSTSVEDVTSRASYVDETVKAAARGVDQLVVRADAAQVGLAHVVPEAERLVGEAHAVRGQLETLQHATASTLVDVGRAHEKLASIEQQAGEAERLIGQLSSGRSACESAVRELSERTENVEQLFQRAREIEANQAEQTAAMQSRIDKAQAVLGELSNTCAIAKSTDEGMAGAIRRAEDVTRDADRNRSRIQTIVASGLKVSEQLDEIVGTGRQLHEAMQGMVAHADEKVVQLDSHQAAASHLAKNLSDMTVTGHELLDGLIESKRGSQEAFERIDRMTTEAWELASNAETRLKEMSDASGAAQTLVADLRQAMQPVEATIAALTDGTSKAKQQVDAMDQRQAQGQQLAKQLGEITAVLDSAQKFEESMKTTHDAATDTLVRLAKATEAATSYADTLGSLSEVADHVQQHSAETIAKAEDAAARLATHLSAVEKAVESGTPLLSDFVKQTRNLESVLGDMDARCAEIEKRVTTAIEKPSEIIATAQAQSAQLERVCQAVRKIFSGLSKATLEARQQINDSRTTNEATSKRLAQLTLETERASNTLHEWVQEAVRVQSRLEGTLGRAPGISETHPADALRAMSRLATETVAMPDVRRADKTPDAPANAVLTSVPKAAIEPARRRAEEVAQLIEDAKRTASAPAN